MKRLHMLSDPLLAGHLRALLESHGIRCVVRNEPLAGAAGGLPPIECWLELWVADADYARARALLAGSEPAGAAAAWRCTRCGETSADQFSQCWRCSAARPCPP